MSINKTLIFFDFEVFKHDTLFGAFMFKNGQLSVIQTWDLTQIKRIYATNVDSIWIGHNNKHYDNLILQTIVKGGSEEDVKRTNDQIIKEQKRLYLDIPLICYDLTISHWCALKQMEAYVGKNISESEVDFDIDRKLTNQEKAIVEIYNLDDLDQTYDDFKFLEYEFLLRLDVISEFNLPITCLSITGTQIAEEVLHAQRIDGISSWVKKPVMWPNLRIKNQAVIDFYLSEEWRNKQTLVQTFCGTPHTLAAGGIHGAKKKAHVDWAYYFDVSGYYNLIMILLDLLPRSIPAEYRKFYEGMYHKQLELKKTDPSKRGVYKTILLSVFGAMNNKFCRFYDPYHGDLVRMSGQMFLVDLLEKCEGKLEVVQSNTDGIILTPINDTTEEEVMDIMKEWQERTGFVLKLDKIYDVHQRDVNTYLYKDSSGEIHTVGDIVTHYGKIDYPFWKDSYNAKEPFIISEAVVNYFMNGKLPEETIEEKKRELRYFQYICKKLSYDYLEYITTDVVSGEESVYRLQNVNRAFAMKNDMMTGMIYKKKLVGKNGKPSSASYQNLPDSVFVHNNEILSEETVNELVEKIDYQYYVNRAYEKILAYYEFEEIKGVSA